MADPFASPQDVADRWRPLTEDELPKVSALLRDASVTIRARFPGIDSQVTSGAVDKDAVLAVCSRMVKRAMLAPSDGISQTSETVGPYSGSQTYANPLGNIFLTAADINDIIGYQPRGSSHRYSNTTIRRTPSLTDLEGLYDGGITVIPGGGF
jgi:hypothetical protein